jgi:hypothetical protein
LGKSINPLIITDGDGMLMYLQSITAKVTAVVTGACMVTTGILFVLYNFIVLGRVKKSHAREMNSSYIDEGIVEKMERKANEPALEPGSVV